MICPLVTTHCEENPPFYKWIPEDIEKTLHQDPRCKKVFPTISTVTRQNKNIAQIVIRSNHWKGSKDRGGVPAPVIISPPGNFQFHSKTSA